MDNHAVIVYFFLMTLRDVCRAQNHSTSIVSQQNQLMLELLGNAQFWTGKPGETGTYVDPEELRLVIVVHRHAERAPVFAVPWGQNATPSSFVPTDAQLTSRGVKQIYEYGQWMRKRYQAFYETNDRIPSQRITIISSHTDRTITSAQALAAGLLPTENTKRQWDAVLGNYWNPIPVYAQPYYDDGLYLFSYDDSECPLFGRLRKGLKEVPVAKQLEKELEGFKETMINATGITNYDFWGTTTAIEDALRYGLEYPETNSIPPWMNTTLLQSIVRVASMRMHLLVGGNGDRLRTRLRGGRLLENIFQRMENASRDDPKNLLKMVFYSAHDENVAALLAALNLYNYTLEGPNFGIPEFTASIIFELFKNNTVRMLLKNNAKDECGDPMILKHPECYSPFCPLSGLRSILNDVIVAKTQFDEECRISRMPDGISKSTTTPIPKRPNPTHIDTLMRAKDHGRPDGAARTN